jgi:hypothetical protein
MTENQVLKDDVLSWNKKQIKPHSGLYINSFVVDQIAYPCLVSVSTDLNFKIILIDQKQNLQNTKGIFIWHDIIRKFIKKDDEKIISDDFDKAKNFFITSSFYKNTL